MKEALPFFQQRKASPASPAAVGGRQGNLLPRALSLLRTPLYSLYTNYFLGALLTPPVWLIFSHNENQQYPCVSGCSHSESSGSRADVVGGFTLAFQQAASLLELGAHSPLSGEQDRSFSAALSWLCPSRALLEPAMGRAAPDRVRECLKIPFRICRALFPSPHHSGQRSPRTQCCSWCSRPGARLWVPVGAGLAGLGARGCPWVRGRAGRGTGSIFGSGLAVSDPGSSGFACGRIWSGCCGSCGWPELAPATSVWNAAPAEPSSLW